MNIPRARQEMIHSFHSFIHHYHSVVINVGSCYDPTQLAYAHAPINLLLTRELEC